MVARLATHTYHLVSSLRSAARRAFHLLHGLIAFVGAYANLACGAHKGIRKIALLGKELLRFLLVPSPVGAHYMTWCFKIHSLLPDIYLVKDVILNYI